MKCCKTLLLGVLLLMGSILTKQSAVSQGIPRTLSVQGVLTDAFESKPLQGKYVIKTGVYETAIGGMPLYEQLDSLTLGTSGLYQLILGKEKGLPLSLKFDKAYFIDMTVNGIAQTMRIPLQPAPYALMASNVAENAIVEENLAKPLREKLFPEKGKDGEGNLANYVGGFRSVIAGGDENRTSANFASILGGFTNSVSGAYSSVVGGQGNQVMGAYSFVGGGMNNRAMGPYTTVTAGHTNTVTSSSSYGTISGGQSNQVGGNHGTISGGQSNLVTTQAGTVSGGVSNRAMQTFATVSGGQNNQAGGSGATVSGGISNTATGQNSFIGGGTQHSASGAHAVVAGGLKNTASGQLSGIGSGQNNIASGVQSTIAGGSNNKATAINTTISGGADNDATGQSATVSGGSSNDAMSDFTTIGGGRGNIVTSTGQYSTIAGGQSNTINSRHSNVSGGVANFISQNSHRSVIDGGDSNSIIHTGTTNTSNNSIIDGGYKNKINNGNFSVIGGGTNNTLDNVEQSIIGGGINNDIAMNANGAIIGGGTNNSIAANSEGSSIFGGKLNYIGTASNHSAVLTGDSNNIANDVDRSVIVGGMQNSIFNEGDYSTITGGLQNTIQVNSQNSFIGGGYLNDIGPNVNYGSIMGGNDNRIVNNVVSNDLLEGDYSTIVGGSQNIINDANYAGVLGGSENTVNGNYGFAFGYRNTAAANALAFGTEATAIADEFSAKYSAGFLFTSQGTNHGGHVADFVNTSTNGNGIRIKVNSCETTGPLVNNSNNFVTFLNKNNTVVGRIEGQTVNELSNDPDYQAQLLMAQLNVASASLSVASSTAELGVAIGDAATRATCIFCPQLAAPGGANVAIKSVAVGSSATALAAAIMAMDNLKASKTNYMGVTYQSGNGDYAEYLPKLDKKEKFVAGQIVAIKGGYVTKNTDNATQLMVISKQPIVLGNAKPAHNVADYEKVAFLGQVPVTVSGEVKLGDYILPDGQNMGMGIAVSPENMNSEDYKRIVGVAWSASKAPISEINVAVGLNGSAMSKELERQNEVNAKQEDQIAMLKKIVCGMNTVIAKLDPEYADNIKKVLGTEAESLLSEPVQKNVVNRKKESIQVPPQIINAMSVAENLESRFLNESDIEYTFELARTKIKEVQGGSYSSSFFESYDSNPEFKQILVEKLKNRYNEGVYKQLEAMNAQAASQQ
jgi:hypothetical protein